MRDVLAVVVMQVKEAAQSSVSSGHTAAAAAAAAGSTGATGTGTGSGNGVALSLDHQCCHQHHTNTHVVQQQLIQLHQQLQQATGTDLQLVTTTATTTDIAAAMNTAVLALHS